MKIEYYLTKKDLLWYYFHTFFNIKFFLLFSILFLGLFFLPANMQLINEQILNKQYEILMPGLFISMVIFSILLIIPLYVLLTFLSFLLVLLKSNKLRNKISLSITSNVIEVTVTNKKIQINRKQVKSIQQDKNALYIHYMNRATLIIPKRIFKEADQLDVMQSWIRTR